MARVGSIVYTPKGSPRLTPEYYVRVPLQEAALVIGHGIEGDRKGGNPNRQLNIMSQSTVDALKAQGLKTAPGELGEQIVIDGFDVADLNPGDRVRLGDAVIEVISFRTGCDRFEHIQSTDPKTLARKLGIMARVVESGAIRVGAPVKVASYASEQG